MTITFEGAEDHASSDSDADQAPALSHRQAAALADYISQCDDALHAELERRNGQWPDHLTVPLPHCNTLLRCALNHWLDELRRKSGRPIRIDFDPPHPTQRRRYDA
jgi:hypothetical protein